MCVQPLRPGERKKTAGDWPRVRGDREKCKKRRDRIVNHTLTKKVSNLNREEKQSKPGCAARLPRLARLSRVKWG